MTKAAVSCAVCPIWLWSCTMYLRLFCSKKLYNRALCIVYEDNVRQKNIQRCQQKSIPKNGETTILRVLDLLHHCQRQASTSFVQNLFKRRNAVHQEVQSASQRPCVDSISDGRRPWDVVQLWRTIRRGAHGLWKNTKRVKLISDHDSSKSEDMCSEGVARLCGAPDKMFD